MRKWTLDDSNLPQKESQKSSEYDLDKKIWGPFKKLPNVSKFSVEISDYDELFQKWGINKRKSPNIKYEPHRNNKLNKYLYHQLKRMTYATPMKYWRMGMHLIRRSNIFYVVAMNHVFPHWARDMKLSSVIRLAIVTRRIASKHYAKLEYTRVYIPKESGKLRPLGVPSYPWRIYLHMINQLLVKFLDDRNEIHPSQHGFRPGRGTLTAWREVLNKVILARDIFEFDLKQFFDKVNLDAISACLLKKGVPVNLVRQLYYLNCSACRVKPPYLLNEFEHMMKRLIMTGVDPDEVINAPRPISYMYRVQGVPQGAPTSPLLATLILEGSIIGRKGLDVVMYADDGVYYGDFTDGYLNGKRHTIPIITPNTGMVNGNIYFNHSKSDWVKRDGQWLKPLKFLGLEYDGVLDKLRAKTRKGSNLYYDKEDLVRAYQEREQTFKDSSNSILGTKWQDFIDSKLAGFIQNRLYTGAWNLDEFEQDFDLSYQSGTYADYVTEKKIKYYDRYFGLLPVEFNVFNITSYASEWLVKKLKKTKGTRVKIEFHR